MSPKPKANKKQISPQVHAKVREQLTSILKLVASGQLPKASSAITPLLRKHPTLPEVNHVASGVYAQSGARDQAIYYAQRALDLDPSIHEYNSSLGVLFVQSDKHMQAIPLLERAIELNPDHQQSHSALGVAYMQTGQINQARTTLQSSIERFPDDHEAIMNLALLESDVANAHQSVELMRRAIERFPNMPILHDSMSMFASYDDQLSPEEVFEIHKAFGKCVQSKVRRPASYPHTADPDKRIRIGFVSSDFKTHSIAYFVEPIFEHLNREHFELFVYSTSSQVDSMTKKLRSHADCWRECFAGIATTHKQIVKDRVDVLVELSGHFAANQLPIFAAKPAPVSITAIGYGNTTGLDTIDARIVDEMTDPSDPDPSSPDPALAYDRLATEQLVRVDGCFLCYRPPTDAPALADPESDRPFTFGSFNDLRKISPSCFQTWAQILIENPASRMILKTSRLGAQQVRDDIHQRFESLGIEQSRIDLLARTQTIADHLNLYNSIDCSLDSFPYTGTTTTCESLWMGVPMLTLLGDAHAGRVSASLLQTINRPDLIADSHASYIQRATEIATKGTRSSEQRQALRNELLASDLVDEKMYTRKIETVYRRLWRNWCNSQAANVSQNGTNA